MNAVSVCIETHQNPPLRLPFALPTACRMKIAKSKTEICLKVARARAQSHQASLAVRQSTRYVLLARKRETSARHTHMAGSGVDNTRNEPDVDSGLGTCISTCMIPGVEKEAWTVSRPCPANQTRRISEVLQAHESEILVFLLGFSSFASYCGDCVKVNDLPPHKLTLNEVHHVAGST